MNFILAIAVYLIMALILGCGILFVVKGDFWLLAVGLLAYLLLLSRFGCLPPKSHH